MMKNGHIFVLFSANFDDSALCTGFYHRIFVGITQDAVANATVMFGDTPGTEQFLALRAIKGLSGSVDPAGRKAQTVSGGHQVAQYQAAVLYPGIPLRVRQHHHNAGGIVEGVSICSQNLCVHTGELIPGSFVPDGYHNAFLVIKA